MYESFYGLHSRPFQLTPDPHYYFESLTHRKALSYLGYGLAQGEGFIVITGDVGAGKTTLVGHLMATIDRARLTAANIVTSKLESGEVVSMAAHHFGMDIQHMDKGQILASFEDFLHHEAREGRRCLLIVDEAQNLSAGALEELRMLSNFQLGGQSLLQIFLLGQPEFRDMLQRSPALEQLRQRVIAQHHLEPMGREEVEPYVLHRLAISGAMGRPQFSTDVFSIVYGETKGVPRKINTLMSRILLMGAVEEVDMIDFRIVNQVLMDLRGDNQMAKFDDPDPDLTPAQNFAPRPQPAQAPSESINAVPGSPLMTKKTPVRHDEYAPAAPIHAVAEPHASLEVPEPVQHRPEPVYAPAQPAPPVYALHEPEVAPEPIAPPPPVHDRTTSNRIDILSKRLSMMETRAMGQEENLQRVLVMLIEWVDSEIQNREVYANAGRAA
jgi:putative secretion ATPase (PEP-CTERM system associated)